MRQMPDEEDKMPSFVVVGATGSPCGHTSEPNPVLDDVVNLAVGQALGGVEVQIRSARIGVRSDGGQSASVDAVAVDLSSGADAPPLLLLALF